MNQNLDRRRSLLPCAFLLLPVFLHAQVLHVDDGNLSATQNGTTQYPYRSVQAAIMNAALNDTIKVAAGTYGPTDNLGKSLVVWGGYTGASSTDYDAGLGGDFLAPTSDAALTVISGGPDSIGVVLTRFDFDPFSLVISNLTVSNSMKGIVCDALISWPPVENVTISDCIVENNGQIGETSLGAGVLVHGNGHQLLNNVIRNNHGGRGAGISGNSGTGDSLLVQGNLIENNTGYDDHCGGVYLGGYAEIRNNIIAGNHLQNSYGWGGGVLILGTAHMSGNVIRNNYCPSYGGAVFVDEGGILYMDHDLIYNNSTSLEGAAVAADYGGPGSSYVYLTNCTIANNHATGGLGGNAVFVDVSSFATAINCIFYGNGDDFHVTGGSSLTVTYTLSEEPVAGQGNFQGDPLFADTANGDFHLRSTIGRYDPQSQSWVTDGMHSPAIDAGDPASAYVNEPSPHGSRINLGHDGNTAYASLSNATGIAPALEDDPFILTYPNPAQSELTITLPENGGDQSDLRILNELGMEVLHSRMGRTIVLSEIALLADGAYVARITTASGTIHWKKFLVSKGE
ncbi:MAG: T9SS type A sorting domain-containing protein [Flavobacteriales bacterium]|nr:T9SS type A sorting domain-containing protein [Flavobacteriales bacterium]